MQEAKRQEGTAQEKELLDQHPNTTCAWETQTGLENAAHVVLHPKEAAFQDYP